MSRIAFSIGYAKYVDGNNISWEIVSAGKIGTLNRWLLEELLRHYQLREVKPQSSTLSKRYY